MRELVERETTLETLRQCLLGASARGHVVLVAGEAGIGKTSVLRAMADEHATHGPVWWGACDALDTPHPMELDTIRFIGRVDCNRLWGRQRNRRESPSRPALYRRLFAADLAPTEVAP